ncbi:MAG: YebC/PmpR family DNA-binding transcriptional regulator [Bacilli bacterium]|nr:YebC/PmpR family DNA-binding transcriptional regulator [Bacilli bacterium]
MGRKFEVRKESMAKTMLVKTKLYSRYGKEIYMCAKLGGSNPDANLSLKHLIDKAKRAQVPTDVIKRNIQKADKGMGEDFFPVRYEGFGPGGTGIIIDCLTDNVNRTVSEVRNAFTKVGCKMGVNGSVEHGYRHLSFISVKGMDEETVLETLIMADLEVLEVELEEDIVEIEANGFDIDKIQDVLKEADESVEIIEAESGWYPLDFIELDDENKALFDKMMALLEESEDVQEIYHNVKED